MENKPCDTAMAISSMLLRGKYILNLRESPVMGSAQGK
jgi:hypothetical protein